MISNTKPSFRTVQSDSYREGGEPSASIAKRRTKRLSASPFPRPKTVQKKDPPKPEPVPEWDFDSADPDVF